MNLLLALLGTTGALAQDYRFPGADEHYGTYYPTAYYDEGGHDWACGDITYGGHRGSDYGAGSWAGMDEGRNVVAAAEGTVIATNDGEYDRCTTADCGEANYVILEHANGRRTWYWHLKQWSVAVSPGQWVSCGQHLGQVGSSGNSTGPHLHFEVREPGNYAGDPFDGPCSAPPTYWIDQGAYGGLPGPSCPYAGPCAQVATLACGQTLASANNAAGATQSHSTYGCGTSTWSGPEIAYAFSTSIAETVTLGLTGIGADVDLFVLNADTCDGSGAVTCSTNPDANEEWVAFDAAPGAVYTVVVDGWNGTASGFNLTAVCNGRTTPGGDDSGAEPSDTSAPADTGGTTDTANDGGEHAGPALPGEATSVLEAGGCGCDDGPSDVDTTGDGPPGRRVPIDQVGCGSGASAFAGALFVAGWRRRRRRVNRP